MFFADAHCDFLSKAAAGGDIFSPLPGQHITGEGVKKYDGPFLTLAVFGGQRGGYPTKEQFAKTQLRCYDRLTEGGGRIRRVKGTAARCGLAFEGLDYVEREEDLRLVLFRSPLCAGLLWNHANALGGSCHEDGPLTPLGKNVVRQLEKADIAVDLAHGGRKTFFDVAEIIPRPFVSHGNVFAVEPHPRNLDEEQLRLLIERKSFLGITFYAEFIGKTGSLERLFRHMEKVLDMGGEEILGFGSDLDGCSPLAGGARGMEIFETVWEEMLRRNYSRPLREGIAYGNWLRFLGISI